MNFYHHFKFSNKFTQCWCLFERNNLITFFSFFKKQIDLLLTLIYLLICLLLLLCYSVLRLIWEKHFNCFFPFLKMNKFVVSIDLFVNISLFSNKLIDFSFPYWWQFVMVIDSLLMTICCFWWFVVIVDLLLLMIHCCWQFITNITLFLLIFIGCCWLFVVNIDLLLLILIYYCWCWFAVGIDLVLILIFCYVNLVVNSLLTYLV